MKKWKHYIDTHKGFTPVAILLMMAAFGQWENATAWVYLALHGTYGIMWVLKSRIFPDKQWETPASIWRGLYIWAGLTLYWIAPFIITSQSIQSPAWLLGLSISMYTFGVLFHYAGDMQKHMALKYHPGHLIEDGLMSRVRNINYFGEFLIYLGFGLLAMHWLPIVVIGLYFIIIWFPNMRKKDKSLSRYPEFAEYKKRSKLFIPFLF